MRGGGRHPHPRLFAQWLLLDPERNGWERRNPQSGVVSHRAALRVHALGDWPGPTVEFTLAPGVAPHQAEGVQFHSAQLESDEWQVVAGLPVTSPGRTLGDLAVNSHADREALGRLAAAILRRSLATHQDLVRALNRCDPPQGGAKQLEDLLATQGGDL
ncbi:hypothetical protein ABZU45_37585 [Streptomyces avermitilis]|uniref:hypothetical protein n=1 Tax=Streptomyces avermitilis TaxID=33903 RepID=UPI0033A4D226